MRHAICFNGHKKILTRVRNRFAHYSKDREYFPKKKARFFRPHLSFLPLRLAWRPRATVSGRDFTVQSAGCSLRAILDRLDRKSMGLVPRMAARRATVRPRTRKRLGDFVMKNFRLASGSACQARQERADEGMREGYCHYFPQPPYVSTVPLGYTRRRRVGQGTTEKRKEGFLKGSAYNLSCRS